MQSYYESGRTNTPPQDEDRIERCSVCGFKGNNAKNIKESDSTGIAYTTTGTVYDAHDIEDIDLEVAISISGSVCLFCGTTRVYDGKAGDLR